MSSTLLEKFRAGAYTEAARLDFSLADVQSAERQASRTDDRFDLVRLRGWFHYLRREYQAALGAQRQAFAIKPNIEGIKNIGIVARNLKDRANAVDFLLEHEREFCNAFEFYDVLAHNCGAFGELAAARRFGTRSLELKHERFGQAGSQASMPAVPPFAPQKDRNIIAFSLFGANPRYVQPLLVSCEIRQHIYPLWTIRIYVDGSVPAELRKTFEAKGCQVVEAGGGALPGTFWRFLVADDPGVDRYLVRDADSILNIRERVAVDEWIGSGRHFHAMRDFYSHSELILAGLWGGARGAFPPMRMLIEEWLKTQKAVIYNQTTVDQIFLRERIWRIFQQSALVHDSIFDFGDRKDFPGVGTLPPWKHVGQDDFIFFKREEKG